MKINIKPLSVNQAWRGRRFKTQKYKDYEKELMYKLPSNFYQIESGKKLTLTMEVGFSSKLSDLDNVAKQFIDGLQKKYDFNDRYIYRLVLEKRIVTKGQEYIDFTFSDYI